MPERSRDPRWAALRSRDEIEDLLDGPLDRYGVVAHVSHSLLLQPPRFPAGLLHYAGCPQNELETTENTQESHSRNYR